MGTSLSGLTPATTFDGLLKTSDNEPLDGTLKAISTGDGTDTILSLSNSALQIGGATTVVSDNTGNDIPFEVNTSSTGLLQIRNLNTATTPILGISHGSQDTRLSMYTTMGFRVQGINIANMTSSEVGVGGGSGARLAVKGSGATSATTSLLVQNSAGSELFKLTDDGNINLGEPGASPIISSGKNSGKSLKLGNQAHLSSFAGIDFKTWDGSAYSEAMRITGNTDQFVGIGETTPTARLHLKGSGNTSADYALKILNSDDSTLFDIRNDSVIRIAPNSTNPVSFRNAKMQDGNAVFGTTTIPASTRITIKGQGATSATTALLVQNSAGTELLKVRDDGYTDIGVNKNIAVANYNDIFIKAGGTYFRDMSNNYHAAITNDGAQFGLGYTGPDTGVRLQVKGSGNDATTTALLVQNSDGADMMVLDDSKEVSFKGRAGFYNGVFIVENNHTKTQGNAIFGAFATPTARLQVKGSGATSATTALLVQNSAGVERLKVRDDGWVDLPGTLNGGAIRANILQVDSINFKVDGTNNYFQSQFTNNVFGGVNTDGDASALVTMKSTTQGFLPPRMTDAERDAITSPAAGLMIYDTSNNQMNYWNGSSWIAF